MASSGDMLQLEVTFASQAQGGRARTPSLKGGWYRPHLVIPPGEEMLGVVFVEGPEMAACAGQPIVVVAKLAYPGVSYGALLPGVKFQIQEGARTVGQGRVIGIQVPVA